MTKLRPPDFDSKPLYTDGVGLGWVGYGIYMGWPSASFQIFDWKDNHPSPVEADDKLAKAMKALAASDSVIRELANTYNMETSEGRRISFALRMMIRANAEILGEP